MTAESERRPRLTMEAEGALSFQKYSPARVIEGVQTLRLRKHRAENGSFCELLRLSNGRVALEGGDFEVRQLSMSHAAPGRLNAFHIHPKLPQRELWCVVQGQLMVWLVDCRAEASTAGMRQQVLLSAEEPIFLMIPAGVAHGYRAGSDGALLIYAMDQQFDPADPNEGRLPWNHFGAELWEEDRG